MSMRIARDELKPGMVLAEPVMNRQGQVMVAENTSITQRHLMILKTWGVSHVTIHVDDQTRQQATNAEGKMSRETLQRAMARLNRRWTWAPRNEVEKEIYLVAVRQAAEISRSESNQ